MRHCRCLKEGKESNVYMPHLIFFGRENGIACQMSLN